MLTIAPTQFAGISKRFPHPKLSTTGLARRGATCYRTAALQALTHCPIFINWLSAHTHPATARHANSPRSCLACALCSLITAAWASPPTHCRERANAAVRQIHALVKHAGKRGGPAAHLPTFFHADPALHGDPHEFLGWVVEGLRRGTSDSTSSDDDDADLNELSALFDLVTRERRVYPCCGHEDPAHPSDRSALHTEMGLRLAPAWHRGGPFRAADLISAHFRPVDPVPPARACPGCGATSAPRVTRVVDAAPQVLVAQVCRAGWDRRRCAGVKHAAEVVYPAELDLSGYMRQACGRVRFALAAVLCHVGVGPTAGHWVAVCRGPGGGAVLADDERVRGVGGRALERVRELGGGYHESVLVYVRE